MATDYVTKHGSAIRATHPIRYSSDKTPCRTYAGTDRNTDGYVGLEEESGGYDRIDRKRYECIEKIGEDWE